LEHKDEYVRHRPWSLSKDYFESDLQMLS